MTQPQPGPGHGRAIPAALTVTVLWSSSWILIRWGLDDEALEPITFAALRYGLAAIVLAGWVAARPSLRLNLRDLDRSSLLRIAALGLVFYAITQGAQFVAIDNQPAATTSLVLSLTPLLVAGLGGRLLAEVASARQYLGAALVALGAWLYFSGDLGATAAGMIAALVGLGANVAASLMGRDVNRRQTLGAATVTVLSMGVGALVLAIVGLAFEGLPSLTWRAGLIVAWLAVVNTALAFTLWNFSLRRLSALESSAINNTMLIQIALLAWLFLDESLGWSEGTGILLVSAGIILSQGVATIRFVGRK
jgi:drug/metabolite transporter (DMT)-like permease